MGFLSGGLDSISSFFSAITELTQLQFWERAGQMVLAVIMVFTGGLLLFRREAEGAARTVSEVTA